MEATTPRITLQLDKQPNDLQPQNSIASQHCSSAGLNNLPRKYIGSSRALLGDPDLCSTRILPPPTSMRNLIAQTQVHTARDDFIAAIDQDAVLRLASSHHNDDPCHFFQPPARGSYNICYFVQFSPPDPARDNAAEGDKWVVRLPLEPCLALGGRDKLETEIATMHPLLAHRLVAEKTSIPLPDIIAYRLGEGSEPFSCYLILRYIHGESIKDIKQLTGAQRQRFYASLASIYAQLRRLEFPAAGRLTRSSAGVVEVRKPPISISLNSSHLEGATPFDIMADHLNEDGTMTSDAAYASMLQRHGESRVATGSGWDVDTRDEWEEILYYDHIFREYAASWIGSQCTGRGPFVLTHGDLESHNILVDKSWNIVGVLDWEWSCVVPFQFFQPPLWIAGYPIPTLCDLMGYYYFSLELQELNAHVSTCERDTFGNLALFEEWNRIGKDGGFLVAAALEEWTIADWFANRFINSKVYNGAEDLADRVKAFMNNPSRQAIADERLKASLLHIKNLETLGLRSCADKTTVDSSPPEIESANRGYRIALLSPEAVGEYSPILSCTVVVIHHDNGRSSYRYGGVYRRMTVGRAAMEPQYLLEIARHGEEAILALFDLVNQAMQLDQSAEALSIVLMFSALTAIFCNAPF
ncbi:hypothetical protein ACRALDRAFT_211013 [Sodiomyces alcalophilus JCM 7366]|uniref:uncharacterized protein n=1 Tax=Sodiomyces alcalophilus JCM 7366 TaxID=591952 RepID=UPI0039B59715